MTFPSTLASAGDRGPAVELVKHDHAALAFHMARCARSRGTWFSLQRHVDAGKAAMAGRLVTVAFIGTAVATTATLLLA